MRPKTSAVVFIFALLAGCAELKDELPPPTGEGSNVHSEGWADPASEVFHGDAVREASWDMTQCQSCHGSDYDGGVSFVSCWSCHQNNSGPENCATCHGSVNPAPPRDLSENELTSEPGVGAHQVHLAGGNEVSSLKTPCGQCHVIPGAVYVAGHVDSDLPAEVIIAGGIGEGKPTGTFGDPTYDDQANTCANTFCHGAWSVSMFSAPGTAQFAYTGTEMTGANFSPLWTGGEAEIECGTCHGLPPPGHIAAELNECGSCHSGIVDLDGTIADKTLHINGKINTIYSPARPF